jgi:pyruvate/2-oxoacid:ferredoxin oxidoreductase alpha subunit
MQEIQAELSQRKGTLLQAEDEITSIGLTVSASLSRTKSMTSTSDPEFDLKYHTGTTPRYSYWLCQA